MERPLQSRPAQLIRRGAKTIVSRAGYEIHRKPSEERRESPFDDERHQRIFDACQPFTMTSRRRVYALIDAVDYVVDNEISGALVECGVWRGGSALCMALTLLDRGVRDREIHLFDTFSGMTAPSPEDTRFDGISAEILIQDQPDHYLCDASLDDVRHNVQSCGYPVEMVHFVEGPVEKTIPAHAPDRVALLRLDTDWYDSTFHELEHLYPLLEPGGVLIIDDYGFWEGARKACDDFFQRLQGRPLLTAIDDTGVIGIVGIRP